MAASRFIPSGLGWQRDLPDSRDFATNHDSVLLLLSKLPPAEESMPSSIDLRSDSDGTYFTSPADQEALNSSSAFACLALIEYFHRRILGQTFDGSPLFLYEMTRKLINASFNSSVDLRSTFKALRRYGAPPERMCRYAVEQLNDALNDISLLGFKQDLENLVYFRLDDPNQTGEQTLQILKSFLAAGFPVAFGFSVPRSVDADGLILCRPGDDSYFGGQSVLAVGYDDACLANNKGALMVRNSWGSEWGDSGYGWLPYAFIDKRLATDFWTVICESWTETQLLRFPYLVRHAHR